MPTTCSNLRKSCFRFPVKNKLDGQYAFLSSGMFAASVQNRSKIKNKKSLLTESFHSNLNETSDALKADDLPTIVTIILKFT